MNVTLLTGGGNSQYLINRYNTPAPQNPTLYSIMFDARLTPTNFTNAIKCGLLGWTEQPALGSSTYTIDEIRRTSDKLDMIKPQDDTPECKALTKLVYALPGGYKRYRYRLSSSGTAFGYVCDRSSPQYSQFCTSQVVIRFGSFVASSMTSVHGISKTEILLDISAILGAVSYITWFLTIFDQ
jgi:hypothetical protein